MTLNFLKKRGRRFHLSLDDVDASIQNDKEFLELTSTSSPVREADLSELQRRLNEAMMKLSDEHRAVVTMFHIQGMPHAEISKILRVSEGTVRSRLFYANRQLQNYLEEFRKNPVGPRARNACMDKFNENDIGKLLRLKRHEQPPPGYFDNFLHEFHRRQRDELLRQPLWRILCTRLSDSLFRLNIPALTSYPAAVAAVLVCAAVVSLKVYQAPPLPVSRWRIRPPFPSIKA